MEVIVVDGGSVDRTRDIVVEATRNDPAVILVDAGPATPGRGRDIGARKAKGEWIAFIDAGVEPDNRWLERLLRVSAADSSVDVVFGSMCTSGGSVFERCADLAYVAPMRMTARGPVRSDFIASSLVRRSAFEAIGGFRDLRAAEDLIFMRELHASGHAAAYACEAEVTWQLQSSFGSTFRRFRSYSMHNVAAGQQRYWHYGVARQWAVAAGVVVVAIIGRRPRLLWLLPTGLAARTGRTLANRREGRSWGWVLRPFQFSTVAAIIAVIDVATLIGWVDALLRQHRRAA
jgi:glycosyltransferase involved in cell wall biosynthesis